MNSNRTILVTGGAGFIGSNLIEKLILAGHRIICLDNFDPFYPEKDKYENLERSIKSELFTLIKGDVRNRTLLEQIFKDHRIETVIHLAAKAGVRPSIDHPTEYFDVNVNGTIQLLEVMKANQVKKLIYASSSSVYGNNVKIPYSESDNVDLPISPYAASKKAGELITHTFHHLYQMDVINLRFFTVYGPGQRPDLAIHKFFKSHLTNSPISIYGDGSTSRDYTFVDDITEGVISAMNYLSANQNVYEIINLGNQHPVKLSELIDSIEEVSGKKFQLQQLPMQAGDVDRTFAEIEKAKRLLNYQPKTKLKEGLKKFHDWFQKKNNVLM